MKKITFGTRQMNTLLDSTLMEKYGFASQTLMELAGLAIAQIARQLTKCKQQAKIGVLVGPGNNGGDGLVAARHLKMMKYDVDIIMFKKLQGKNGNYHKLCLLNQIPSKDITEFIVDQKPQVEQFQKYLSQKDLLIDGIFGFPFKGDMRSPYKQFIPLLSKYQQNIFSIDIPSGWDANSGNIKNLFVPKYLISLGMPKQCSQNFKGDHYFILEDALYLKQCVKSQEYAFPNLKEMPYFANYDYSAVQQQMKSFQLAFYQNEKSFYDQLNHHTNVSCSLLQVKPTILDYAELICT